MQYGNKVVSVTSEIPLMLELSVTTGVSSIVISTLRYQNIGRYKLKNKGRKKNKM